MVPSLAYKPSVETTESFLFVGGWARSRGSKSGVWR